MPTIYLDLDDVLVDFTGAALELHGWSWGKYKRQGLATWHLPSVMKITVDEFWEPIQQLGASFWEMLNPLPWFGALIEFVESNFDEWYIATSPSPHHSSYVGKLSFLQRAFGFGFNQFVFTNHKHLLANPNAVLVDDRPDNVEQFVVNGGNSILFPCLTNKLYKYAENPMAIVLPLLGQLIKEEN